MIAGADAICARLNAALEADKITHPHASEIARSAPPRAALELSAVAELSKLTPPAAIAHDWRQMIAFRGKLARELVKLGQVAKANDAAAIRALGASKEKVHLQLLTTTARDGFKDCSRVG